MRSAKLIVRCALADEVINQMNQLVGGLDHVILAVPDLDHAAQHAEQALGLAVTGGGAHPEFGTANRIVVIGDSYLELICAQPGVAPRGFIGRLLTRGAGWVGYALYTPDAAGTAAKLRSRGLSVSGPDPGHLAAAAYSRSWQTLHLEQPPRPGLPFLIQHETSGEERRRLLAGHAGLRAHPLGVHSIAGLTIAVSNLTDACADYVRYLNLGAAREGTDAMLDADTAGFTLGDGLSFTLAAPRASSRGPLAQTLATSGEGLIAVTLAVADLTAAVALLRGRGIGVRVDEPAGVLVAAQLQHRQTWGARFALVAAPRMVVR
jgi:catechol 2,3-dioxygenase-like lactoylglutathione lyase family enzyme